jgi:hypothetical protein
MLCLYLVYTNYYNITAPLLLLKNKYTIIKNNIYIQHTPRLLLIYSKKETELQLLASTINIERQVAYIVDRK